jgi:GcrA cell cycle regulator
MSDVNWNEENTATLKQMWADGFPHSEIAAQIRFATRSAIAGKIMRLRLPPPDRKKSQPGRKRSQPTPLPAPQAKANGHYPAQRRSIPENLKGEAPDGNGIKFSELSSTNCHWPKGDPRDPGFEFCGAHAVEDKPYCAFHMRKAKRAAPVSELIDA